MPMVLRCVSFYGYFGLPKKKKKKFHLDVRMCPYFFFSSSKDLHSLWACSATPWISTCISTTLWNFQSKGERKTCAYPQRWEFLSLLVLNAKHAKAISPNIKWGQSPEKWLPNVPKIFLWIAKWCPTRLLLVISLLLRGIFLLRGRNDVLVGTALRNFAPKALSETNFHDFWSTVVCCVCLK